VLGLPRLDWQDPALLR